MTRQPTPSPTVLSSPIPTVLPTPQTLGERVYFKYTGSYQTFYVPSGVTSITVDAYGAQGGSGVFPGGFGGYIETTVSVTPNSVLYIYVGGAGQKLGGYNGGGNGAYTDEGSGGGGGGATDIRTILDDLSTVSYTHLTLPTIYSV